MKAIFTELDKFKEKTVDELREWYKDILPILEYNQNHFFDFRKKEPRQENMKHSTKNLLS